MVVFWINNRSPLCKNKLSYGKWIWIHNKFLPDLPYFSSKRLVKVFGFGFLLN